MKHFINQKEDNIVVVKQEVKDTWSEWLEELVSDHTPNGVEFDYANKENQKLFVNFIRSELTKLNLN